MISQLKYHLGEVKLVRCFTRQLTLAVNFKNSRVKVMQRGKASLDINSNR